MNVVHGDLKPGNVFLGGPDRNIPLVADWGSSRRAFASAPSTMRSAHMSVQITIEYAAPEVLEGKAPSQPSDMYVVWLLLRASGAAWLTTNPAAHDCVSWSFGCIVQAVCNRVRASSEREAVLVTKLQVRFRPVAGRRAAVLAADSCWRERGVIVTTNVVHQELASKLCTKDKRLR